jgi:hypothetical protein
MPDVWTDFSEDQKNKAIRSHLFLKEKHEDGKLV